MQRFTIIEKANWSIRNGAKPSCPYRILQGMSQYPDVLCVVVNDSGRLFLFYVGKLLWVDPACNVHLSIFARRHPGFFFENSLKVGLTGKGQRTGNLAEGQIWVSQKTLCITDLCLCDIVIDAFSNLHSEATSDIGTTVNQHSSFEVYHNPLSDAIIYHVRTFINSMSFTTLTRCLPPVFALGRIQMDRYSWFPDNIGHPQAIFCLH